MPKFKISRTVKAYEHTEIDAESFDQALDMALGNPSDHFNWENSQLGEDWYVTGVASLNAKGELVEDRDVDEDNGSFID